MLHLLNQPYKPQIGPKLYSSMLLMLISSVDDVIVDVCKICFLSVVLNSICSNRIDDNLNYKFLGYELMEHRTSLHTLKLYHFVDVY